MKNRARASLYIVRYGMTGIYRSLAKSIAIIFVVLVMTILIGIISQTIFLQEQTLESVYAQYFIDVTVMDELCIRDTNLKLPSKYYDIIESNLHNINDYITGIKIRSTETLVRYGSNTDSEQSNFGTVVGLTYLPDREEFGYKFQMLPGYTEEVFFGDDLVCVVPKKVYENLKNKYTMVFHGLEEMDDPISYTVAGIHEGVTEDFYCSYKSYNENFSRDEFNIYSFKFSLKNAKYSDNVSSILKRYFIEPSIAGAVKREQNELKLMYEYSFVMPKGNLDDVVKPIESDIHKLKIVEPFLFILSIATGFVVSFLSTRNRKAEFAIMRSLGTSRGLVFFEAFIEQFILCIIGIALGIAIFFVMYGSDAILVMWKIYVFFALYMFATAISALYVARLNVMKIMKAKE